MDDSAAGCCFFCFLIAVVALGIAIWGVVVGYQNCDKIQILVKNPYGAGQVGGRNPQQQHHYYNDQLKKKAAQKQSAMATKNNYRASSMKYI
jgi:hypothetical protein